MLIYQIIIAAFLFVFLVNVILNLIKLKSLKSDCEMPAEQPLISLLIPARNEAANIAACLESLMKQDFPNFEVLVLDDNSSDDTGSIIKRIASSDNRIHFIQGEPLPPGWTGKAFACYQLAREARGEWLLFTDADTTHEPHMLHSVLSLALHLRPSLLSGFPHQVTKSFWEKTIVPVFYMIILCWLPIWLLQGLHKRPPMVNGQFLFFNSNEYWRIGGHQSVKSKIMEDINLGINLSKQDGNIVVVDLSSAVHCRMYQGIKEMWKGFAKSIYGVTSFSPLAMPGLLLAAYIFLLSPFLALVAEIFSPSSVIWIGVIIIQVALLLIMRLLVDRRFKVSLVSVILYPIGISFFFANAVYALYCHAFGNGIEWKQREYSRETGIK